MICKMHINLFLRKHQCTVYMERMWYSLLVKKIHRMQFFWELCFPHHAVAQVESVGIKIISIPKNRSVDMLVNMLAGFHCIFSLPVIEDEISLITSRTLC